MASSFKLKNLQDQEFSITHPDGAGAISINSNNIATKDSPAFTGSPTAPTPTAGDNSTKIATTAFIATKQDILESGTNIKTINSVSLLGSGNINISTEPTTAQVGTATAGLGTGSVGSYALFYYGSNVDIGQTAAGSSLKYSSADGSSSSSASGTWRSMGKTAGGSTGGFITVWLRIA